jgi:glycine betaine/proline transport system substrate-binding protein
MKNVRRTAAVGAMLMIIMAVALFIPARSAEAERKDVVLAQFDWPASIGLTAIMKQTLVQKLKITATSIPLSQDVGWQHIEKGILDAATEIWWPARDADIQLYVRERKTVAMSLTYDNAPQGIAVPTWVAEKYKISNLDDLRTHAPLFDLTGDGKGDIWVGAAAWQSTQIMKIKVRDYELNLMPFTEDTWVFYGRFQKAMAEQRPIVFYYWEPDWLAFTYDLTWIQEPAYAPDKWHYVRGHPDQSRITCAWQPAKIYTVFSEKLKARLPKAYRFFQNFYMPIKEVNHIIAEIENIPGNPKKDPDVVAAQWIKTHPEIVSDWLKGIE